MIQALTPGQLSLCTDLVSVTCAAIGVLVLACIKWGRP